MSEIPVGDLMQVSLATLAVATVCLGLIIRSVLPYNCPKGVPCAPVSDLPIIGRALGSLIFIDKNWDRLPDFVLSLDRKFGRSWFAPVPRIGMLGGGMFSLVSEANVKHVLKDNFANYEKGANVKDALSEFLGDGIFTTDGALWKHHRKVASHMFSRNLMRHGTLVAIRQVKQLVKRLEKHSASPDGNKPVDMQDLFFRMTIDVFASIAFGVDLDSILGDCQHPFALAFDEVQNLSQKRFKDPLWKIRRALQATEEERNIKKCVAVMDDFAEGVINARRRDAKNGENIGPDLLSRFLDVKDGQEPPSSSELRDIVMNFMIAGRDTTACALSWTMYELARHPEVTARVVNEVNKVCNDSDDATHNRRRSFSDLDYSFEKIGNLEYTHAVAMEALRLHPSVPVDIKFAKNDDVLPDGTPVTAGSSVMYSPYAMGRNKDIWGEDAEEFKPERFLGTGEPSQYKFTTFNAGYRLCLGKSLALLEIKLALSLLLPKFHFTFPEGQVHDGGYQSTLVLPMKPNLMMSITTRADK